jgi:FkbM family methyltransferase
MTRAQLLYIFIILLSNILIIIITTTIPAFTRQMTVPTDAHRTLPANSSSCLPNTTTTDPPSSSTEICSSLAHLAIDVPATTRIRFTDGRTAFVANSGRVDGIDTDGGLSWYSGDFPRWEHTTFLVFRALLKPNMVYVGFGEWIGPTILYSAQLAKVSYGFEPDTIAFRSLALNAKANQCFGDRLRVFSLCIYMHVGELILKDAAGGSVSSIVDESTGPAAQQIITGPTVSVRCVTLEQVLRNHSLMEERLFLKVDTEGAEALLIPSLVPLMHKLKHLPTWFLSKHQNSRYAEPHIQQGFRDLIALYKCHRYMPASHQTSLSREQMLSFKLSALPTIADPVISSPDANPDLILVDAECAVVDQWIQEVAHLFAQ